MERHISNSKRIDFKIQAEGQECAVNNLFHFKSQEGYLPCTC